MAVAVKSTLNRLLKALDKQDAEGVCKELKKMTIYSHKEIKKIISGLDSADWIFMEEKIESFNGGNIKMKEMILDICSMMD